MAAKYLQLSKILKKLLFERDIRPADLAREIDMKVPTIHRIVTGKVMRPVPQSLEAIAKYLNVTVPQLIGEEPLDSKKKDISSFKISKEAKIVPIITWEQIDDFIATKIVSPQGETIVLSVSDDSFALEMPDHSMEPLFGKSSTLIFDPHASIIDRNYVLVKLNTLHIYLFRQLVFNGVQKFIKPINNDISSVGMQQLHAEDKIIARLVEVRNKL